MHIADREADPDVRGFHVGEPAKVDRLRSVGRTFIHGYNLALVTPLAAIPAALDRVERPDRGFAYEGAAMALALLDTLTPWSRRLVEFADRGGSEHVYMVNVGAGWAYARLRRRIERPLRRLDPLLGWLAIDGYGFHEGYFRGPRRIGRQKRPRGITGSAARVFDQGLGRSLWFVECADVERVAHAVVGFAPERHADLWAGVGLAATYAGGISAPELHGLRRLAGRAAAVHLGQGAAFAAKARQRAGNPTPETDLACRVFCEMPAHEAARLTDVALAGLGTGAGPERYERWRAGVRDHVARAFVA